MSQQASIKIEGVKQTVTALKAFAPDIYKRMNKEIRKSITATRSTAQGIYPQGAWSISITQKKILGQIRASGGARDDKKWSNSAPGVKAAMFEFLGSQGMANTPDHRKPQVGGLIASLNRRYGDIGAGGRFLWAAWDKTGSDVLENIAAAVRAAEAELQARLDSEGMSY